MSKIADAEANATSLDGLVNDNGLITTLRNGPKPSYQYLVDGWTTEVNDLLDRTAGVGTENAYETTAEGIAATVDGDYFSVVSADDEKYLDLYKNESGVAVYQKSYPSSLIVTDNARRSIDSEYKLQSITKPTIQLFNVNDTDNKSDYFVDYADGVVKPLAGYYASHAIPVTPALNYSMPYLAQYAFYNESMVFQSGGETNNKTITAPTGSSFMRVSWQVGAAYYVTKQMVSETSEVRDFKPYSAEISSENANLTSSAIEGGAVTQDKLSFLSTGKNLVNIDLANFGFIGSNGAYRDSATYKVTDFIEVKPSTTYSISKNGTPSTARFVAAYDENKIIVASESVDAAGTTTLTTPASGVKFYRLSYDIANESGYQFEEGAAPTDYEAFYYELESNNVRVNPVIPKDSITENEVSFLQSKNLFNVEAITLNNFMGSNGVLTASGSYSVSDYIAVLPSTTYHCTSPNHNMRFYTAFDANKNVVQSAGSDVGADTLTVPASGVSFYRVSINTNERALYQFEEGTEATNFEPFGVYKLDPSIIVTAADYDYSRWSGTQFVSYGDSITAQSEWQPFVASSLNLNSDVYGVGGRKVSGVDGMCQDSQLATLPASIELLVFLGGTNDWAQSVPLGAVDSVDTNTFYGAYNVMVEKLFTTYKTSKMLFMTTPYGELPQRLTDGSNWPDAATNNEGLTTRDYAEAVRVMSKRWGFSVVDLDNLGWNTFNIDDFTKDDGGMIHPDSVGGARLAEVVIGKLRSQTPL